MTRLRSALALGLPGLLAALFGASFWHHRFAHPALLHIDEAWVWASSQLGALPFGDGWRGTDETDRLLPPLHVWASRALGGGLPAVRWASLLEGGLAATATALWVRQILPRRVFLPALAATAVCALWHTPLDGSGAGTAWGGFATTGRYDMAGLLAFAALGATSLALEQTPSRRAAALFGLTAGLGLVCHGTAVPTALAAGAWGLWRAPSHRTALLAGLGAGTLPLGLWLATGGSASLQLLAQLDRSRMLVDGAVSPGARWQSLWQDPTLGGVLLVTLPLCAVVFRPRSWVGWSVVGTWGLTEMLSGQSGGNYALLALPGCVASLALLAASGRRTGALAALLGAALCAEGLLSALNTPPLPRDDTAAVRAAVPPDSRVLVNLRNLPAVQDRDALLPFFVLQWHARPDDPRSLAERLDAWCPTVVVTNTGDWPLSLVRPAYGGPALERWLAERVDGWEEPVPGLRVGRVEGCGGGGG